MMINHIVQNPDGSLTVRPSTQTAKEGSVGVVPSDIPIEDWPYISGDLVEKHDGLSEWVFSVDTEAKASAEAEAAEQKARQDAAISLEKAIYDQMYEVFRTRNPETANADHETWKLMVATPDIYTTLGLKTSHQVDDDQGVELFSPGSALDTAEKIVAYATRKIEQAEEYAIFRLQQKQQFIDSKA